MRGRSTCPTGQEKKYVGATGGSPPFFISTRKGWVLNRPLIRPGFAGPPSPQGEGFGGWRRSGAGWKLSFTKMLSSIVSLENASQIGLSIPEEIAPQPYQRQRSPKRASGSKRAINPGSRGLPLVFFPPTFFKESRAPPPESAGNPRCRVHPATVPTEPPTDDRGPPPGRRPPGALRPKAGFGAAHPKGTQAGHAARAHSPALAPQGCSSSWACWR